MLRRILPFVVLTLICFGTASAQTPVSQSENVSLAVEKSGEKSEKVTETKIDNSIKIPRVAFSPNVTSRVGVVAGQTQPLTLNEAIRRALENNNDIEMARTDVQIAEQGLRAAEGVYDPSIGVTPTFTRNSTTGQGATNDFTVNSDFSQNIRIGGGNYRVFYNNFRTENRFSQAQVSSGASLGGGGNSALFSSALGVSFTQPLWRNREIDANRRLIKIQRKRLEQSDADFRQRTIEIIAQVQRSYWDLVFALRNQQNTVENLNLTKENLRRVEAQITAGTAAPLARAEVATELANRESEVLQAAERVTNAENTLKQLLLKDPEAPEWKTQLLPTDEPSFDQTPVKLEDALAEAKSNRPELRRLNLQREINDIDIRYYKDQTRPRIDLNGTVSLEGLAQSVGQTDPNLTVPQFTGNEEILRQRLNALLPPNQQIPNPNISIPSTPGYLVGGYNQATLNLFRSDAPNFSVGVTIQIPVGNRTAKANLATAKIQQTRLEAQTRDQEQAVIAEVRNSVQAVETARQRIQSARTARENAEVQLRGEQKLFEVGRSTTFLLFQRENALARARNEEIRAQTDYNKALADLQRATSTTLRTNNIVVVSPVAP